MFYVVESYTHSVTNARIFQW